MSKILNLGHSGFYMKTEDKYFQHGAHGRQCEYCAKFFDLTTDDFLAHQEFCKNK